MHFYIDKFKKLDFLNVRLVFL